MYRAQVQTSDMGEATLEYGGFRSLVMTWEDGTGAFGMSFLQVEHGHFDEPTRDAIRAILKAYCVIGADSEAEKLFQAVATVKEGV